MTEQYSKWTKLSWFEKLKYKLKLILYNHHVEVNAKNNNIFIMDIFLANKREWGLKQTHF